MNNWIEVSDEALVHNLQVIRSVAGADTEVLAVIKANAYGHGAEHCAVTLARAGTRYLGVTGAEEGTRVRRALLREGLEADILIMSGFLPGDVEAIRAGSLIPVLWTADHLHWLGAETASGLRAQIEINTGMGRQGVDPGQPLADLLDSFRRCGLVLDGVFTHLCSSEVAGSDLTRTQQAAFAAALEQVRAAGFTPRWIHIGNSSSVDNPLHPAGWLSDLARSCGAFPMVRPGLALFGFCLPIEGTPAPHPQLAPGLRPVLTWKAAVLAVRDLAPGETVGYNATFTAPTHMRVALLPVGYADGLRRELSSRGWAIIHGRRAPFLGRISMNLTVVDITAIPQAMAGHEATILGHGITSDDHARMVGTIPYEILCGIHPCG